MTRREDDHTTQQSMLGARLQVEGIHQAANMQFGILFGEETDEMWEMEVEEMPGDPPKIQPAT